MSDWEKRFLRERAARKEAEKLLEEKSLALWELNQSLEKRIEARTAELKDALNEARMANNAKDYFLSNMSHEIRTPLNGILGFVTLLKHKTADAGILRYLDIIQSSSKNLLNIINDILDFSKIKSGNFTIEYKENDIRKELKQNCTLFQSIAREKQIHYTINIDEQIPHCLLCDETRVSQVIANFLSNAMKFTPEKGRVTAQFFYKEQHLIGKIIDTGVGIAKEKHSIIFNAFEQEDYGTNKQFGGTGLGLSITKELIEHMYGEIIFKSTKGEGSEFGFKLPMQACQQHQDTHKEMTYEAKQGHALIVDDNETNRLLLSLLLEQYGLTYVMVEDGFKALEKIQEEEFDIIFMDEQMPNMSGGETTQKIRQWEQEMKRSPYIIIGVSASATLKDQERILGAGMDDFISKPIDVQILDQKLEQYLEHTPISSV
jgi:signal transduction histidine kinase/ActR/RegA family two-component response regulator